MNRLLTKKNAFLILILSLFVIGSVFIYKAFSNRQIQPTQPIPESETKINLDPPTEQELNETAEHKEKLSNEGPTTNADTTTYGKTKVTPVITSASQTELRAYISGAVEDGGICLATFRQGTNSFTKQSSGFGNVNTTVCSPISLDRSDFTSPGEWSVTLGYSSNDSSGVSQPINFEVQ